MPVKRNRDVILDFDPNRSDSDDENFDPSHDREDKSRRSTTKRSRSAKVKGPRRRDRYGGSDIDDDDDDIVSDSEGNGDFDDEDDEEDDMPINAGGRRTRKAAARPQNYREESEDEIEETPDEDDHDDEDEDEDIPAASRRKKQSSPPPQRTSTRPSRIVTLKTNPKNLPASRAKEPPTPGVSTRRTRAQTEEREDFLELSASGRHARATRASTRSKSPEAFARATRATKSVKGIKKPPAPIEEATQEGSMLERDEPNELAGDIPAIAEKNGESAQDENGDGVEPIKGDAADEVADPDAENHNADEAAPGEKPEEPAAVDEDDDDDDAPVTRRTRQSRNNNNAASVEASAEAEEADNESEAAPTGRRLRQRQTLRQKKSPREPSSDFEPGEDSGEGEGGGSGSDASVGKAKRSRRSADDDDEDYSGRGRRTTQTKRAASRRESGDEDLELDQEELAEELEELRQTSRPRRRQRSPSITYEQPRAKRRRVTKPVDYSIKPLDQLVQEDEEDHAPTPPRRGGKAASSNVWQRNLASTYGPFGGGGGLGSLLGGPWGTGATGGVESDSSDDEAAAVRPSIGGPMVGMTPTTATGPGFGQGLPGLDGVAGVAATPNLGKVKNQKAFADADPLGVDLTVDFSKVGGLQGHIDQLKEMIMLPLLYPELFLRYKVTPPRGVLFHGPPGTGKTLLARALSNAVGIGGRKITFYMRKGADALSKWVGEAEKQLRLLFEEARRTQPSIIFFDEIDGLAPVRSSKQEQIHASIVSTLLALMDGMDGRGQVIVIGATNRPDSVDPALRRPGRFDREFYFPLPDVEGRRSIIDIHTKDWGLSNAFKDSLARNTKGYGGADLRALCTEASLNAIQRTYPQIYSSTEKLVVDPEKITIHATDFMITMKKMVPSSQRSASSSAAPLPASVEPLIGDQLKSMIKALDQAFPRKKKTTALEEAMFEPYEDNDNGFGRENLSQEFDRLRIFRPRLLISGRPGMGQDYISAAILHHLEGVFVQNFDLATLLADGSPLEQVIVRLFTEVKRHKPAVIFIPNLGSWHATLHDLAYNTFVMMLRSIPATEPVLLLASAEDELQNLDQGLVKDLFGFSRKNRREIETPSEENRIDYFRQLVSHIQMSPLDFPDPSNRKKRVLEELPVAPAPPPRQPTKEELESELHTDHICLNLLKVQLQPIMDQIKSKYRKFRNSVIPIQQIEYLWREADPNYVRADRAEASPDQPYVIAKDKDGVEGLRNVETNKFFYNLDVTTIEERLSNGFYARPIDFFNDIESLAKDAKNIGDRERTLKANELVSNVRVDVHDVSTRLHQIDFNALHARQQKRAKEAEEKRKKREAMQRAVVDLVQSDVVAVDVGGGQAGPLTLGAPRPAGTTSARFRVMSPLTNGDSNLSVSGLNGGDYTSHNQSSLSNGNSVPSRPSMGDITMGGTWEGSQRITDMGPPPKTNTQPLSQVSLVGLPPGVSPSAIPNDASTTRSTDVSGSNRSSGLWDRSNSQAVNGYPPPLTHLSGHGSGSDAQSNTSHMPDTLPIDSVGGVAEPGQSTPSQSTSGGSQLWPHSQAQGIAQGELQPRGLTIGQQTPSSGSAYGSGPGSAFGYGYGPRPDQASPTASRSQIIETTTAAAAAASSRRNITRVDNILNAEPSSRVVGRPTSGQQSSSSQGASQAAVLDEMAVEKFLRTLTERTSGCTVDQLEQINREMMEELWATRGEWNRSMVMARLGMLYNDAIQDIEEMQGPFPSTQQRRDASRPQSEYARV